ncbi:MULTISPECIES: hypothetical protein [Methylobacterium]|jgi:hypothetical protein|uniref:Protamine-2 (Modular protein) n=1 Tax=Methylobacterium hispanicum TaxID=270350 RepID=A0AAV4ZNF7_9HYPH|nr:MULTISPECIES: hypothetical protein [Methylobacterium]GJD89687.1 hypothetical protein BHAOGJBA_3217 [Methylobacterium hispanicum]
MGPLHRRSPSRRAVLGGFGSALAAAAGLALMPGAAEAVLLRAGPVGDVPLGEAPPGDAPVAADDARVEKAQVVVVPRRRRRVCWWRRGRRVCAWR